MRRYRLKYRVRRLGWVMCLAASVGLACAGQLDLRLSWGHTANVRQPYYIGLSVTNASLLSCRQSGFERGDRLSPQEVQTTAGRRDIDALLVTVSWTNSTTPSLKPHSTWQYLLDHGEPGQVARLKDDPGLEPNPPMLTVATTPDATRGFSIGLEALQRHGSMWLPSHDIFVTTVPGITHAAHLAILRGSRVLDAVHAGPDATLDEWRTRWEDFGNPNQWNQPWETTWMGLRGHLTGMVARHGSIYKFGVDRWGNIRPDFASPHKFRLDVEWPGATWVSQRIDQGLPILRTVLNRESRSCELEQFAAPLDPSHDGQPGDVPSVFLTRIHMPGSGPATLRVGLGMENTNRYPELRRHNGHWSVLDPASGRTWLAVQCDPSWRVQINPAKPLGSAGRLLLEISPTPGVTQGSIVLKLPSPPMPEAEVSRLFDLDYAKARQGVVDYWTQWLSRGALFEVPEPPVNDLFRANLWHALALPRHRLAPDGTLRMDLPYSNYAYGQQNADWPINQAVYVDALLFGLRGHFDVAERELAAMFNSQQKPDGRISGYAEWGVYSPGMLYAVGRNFLLSGDRASFERLLPAALKTLDWCSAQLQHPRTPVAAPLVMTPLNDLTHEPRPWAFPNAYFVAGLESFGAALAAYGHPRAAETQTLSTALRASVQEAFARASVRSPVVQLRDGTWNNYVPGDALTPRRMLDAWYPTDVDCGPLHLARLQAVDPRGWLATAMLHDHEDNLFFRQLGMANEPVYNQQATVYLFRDEPGPAIRAFYSMMACAFSHGQLTPLEHRWAWGQYYMPPSTDGAWFELYRNMLILEQPGDSLLLASATPRRWLQPGLSIRVERAPTAFGEVSFEIHTRSPREIQCVIQPPQRALVAELKLRLRHPERKPLKAVTLNGRRWRNFDPTQEWIVIPRPGAIPCHVVAHY